MSEYKAANLLKRAENAKFNADEASDIDKAVKALIDTNFSASDEAQGKAAQLFKGLLLSEDPKAKKFVKKLDKALSAMAV